VNLDKSQTDAIEHAASRKLSLVIGIAGCGKTTIVKEIYNRLASNSPVLCAPTGKAAARLREATGYPARTIHSILGYNGSRFTAGNLNGQTVIVDEASMLSSDLLAALAKRRPERIVLVGDYAQLHPVGAGAPFHDIIQLRPDVVAELTTCYRSSEAVCQAGNSVRQGIYPGQVLESPAEKFTHVIVNDPIVAQKSIVQMAMNGDLDFTQDIVLCPKNGKKGEDESYAPCTRKALNRELVAAVNPHDDGEAWKVNDRIICTSNFPDADIWNGTTGTITAIDSEKQIWVETDNPTWDKGREEWVNRSRFGKPMIAKMEHAYALSVHKSQGSQYRKVVFCCFSRDAHRMLNRGLVYTAITRAKQEVIVIGDAAAFIGALQRQESKSTVLQQLARDAN